MFAKQGHSQLDKRDQLIGEGVLTHTVGVTHATTTHPFNKLRTKFAIKLQATMLSGKTFRTYTAPFEVSSQTLFCRTHTCLQCTLFAAETMVLSCSLSKRHTVTNQFSPKKIPLLVHSQGLNPRPEAGPNCCFATS